MFRVTQYVNELLNPTPPAPRRDPPGPVVIWNLIRRCNLVCKHCYSISADADFPGELTTGEAFDVMDDLKRFGVPVLVLSGGEPLLRPDIFEVSRRAKEMGFFVCLSSNGTLIDERNIGRITGVGYDYVGVSLDGIGSTHDAFRRKEGAFEAAMRGLGLCRDGGVRVGVRFTMTKDNAAELPRLLDLVERENIDRFFLSHLNYAGRGNRIRGDDVFLKTTRWAMNLLFETSLDYAKRNVHKEFVTGNNDADGVFLLLWAGGKFPPPAVGRVREKLVQWGGNASGINVANIDNLGNVHPDTFWWHYNLGNVRERPFSEIWMDTTDPIMAGLKARPRRIKGRCGKCAHFDICGGNTRIRALRLADDPWAEDPACYLTDREIGVDGGAPVGTAPREKRSRHVA